MDATQYRITAQIVCTRSDGWTSTRQVPTFTLDANIHGLRDEAAAQERAIKMIRNLMTDGGNLSGYYTDLKVYADAQAL